MKMVYGHKAKPLVFGLVLAALTGCGLPQVGPNKSQIFAGSVQREGDSFVIEVNDRVTRATAVTQSLGFSDSFKNAGTIASDTIRPGDTLSLAIWENVDDALLGSGTGGPSQIAEVQVDSAGFIFVPYAGRIKAAGNSPNGLRDVIVRKLAEQTPDPQVEVRRAAGGGATVSIAGDTTGQGVYPIEQSTRTLAAMLARSGPPNVDSEIAQITVLRGKEQGTIWFEDLYSDPSLDIALRNGDRILIEGDPRSFTALGATGSQGIVRFESQNLSALEAIAQVGGLQSTSSDPTGVFVFRNEVPEIANTVLGRNDMVGPQRMIYVLNLTQPNGIFLARDFVIRDDDTLYVTEAPYTQFAKVLGSITGTLTPVANIETIASSF